MTAFTGTRLLVVMLLCATAGAATSTWRPVALMHGLLASKEAMSHAAGWISEDYPGIHICNVEVGNGKEDSLFMDINDQVAAFAEVVKSDPLLAPGFNLIAHSQGGLLARAYVERYMGRDGYPPVFRLITWAGPHDGVYGVPDFNLAILDKLFSEVVDGGWQSKLVQQTLSFAAYWKDPMNYTAYLESNIFLADINNERPVKNSTYKENMLKLDKLLLVDSTVDQIVHPFSSPWFQFFRINTTSLSDVVPFNQTEQYKGDWLGLQTLDKAGKVLLRATDCPHQNLPRASCKNWYDLYTRPLLNCNITLPALPTS